MGAWGYGLFESDDAYDMIGDIEQRARYRLYHPVKNTATVAAKLNSGLLEKLFTRYMKDGDMGAFVYTGALAMLNGADISPERREQLVANVQSVNLRDAEQYEEDDSGELTAVDPECVNQMNAALAGYQNGTPWDFNNQGLLEKVSEHIASGKTGLVNV